MAGSRKRRANSRGPRFDVSGGRRPPALRARRFPQRTKSARIQKLSRRNVALSNFYLHLRHVLSYLEKKGLLVKNAGRYEVGVFFVPNRELVAMKKKFLGKAPETVDVLAFPEPGSETASGAPRRFRSRSFTIRESIVFPHPETRKIILGEIYLNRRLVKAEPARGRFLLRHGLLHLLGYRHRGKSDTIKMQNLEEELQEYYDTGFAIHNRFGYRHRIHKSCRRGKSRRSSGA